MNEFTKGPWIVRDKRSYGCDTIIGADKNFVAETGSWTSEFKDEQHANAHLISASPTMYEALVSVIENYENSNDMCDAIHGARLAISKAEGK